MQTHRSGFTLIELMIAVVIVSLLIVVALPAFQEQIAKGRRAEGKAALLKAMQLQERYYTANGTYAGNDQVPALFGLAAGPIYSGENPNNPESWYVLTADTTGCSPANLNVCVRMVATPRTGYTDANCGTLSLNSAGVRTIAEDAKKDLAYCWSR